MKNKKAEQIAAKEKRREQLKSKRRAQQDFERNEPIIFEKPTILIVCEGENTEPSYFNQFRLSSAKVISIGEGYSTDSLVRRAEVLSQMEDYDQVWCVFDADPKPDNPHQAANFNRAIQINVSYDGKGSKVITEDIFEVLDGIDEKTGIERKQLAITRAKRNYNQLDHNNPAIEDSSTTVFRLVEELLKYV